MTPETRDSRQPRRRPWLRGLRDIALLLLVFFAIQWWQSRDLAAGPAPPLVGHLVDGSPYQLNSVDGPVLVHFWATWCPVCRLEQDNVAAIAKDGQVITVATTSGTSANVSTHTWMG